MTHAPTLFVLPLIVCATVGRLHGDALVMTRAMRASTIAEIFVEEAQVRCEVEVGADDIVAFQNILPDELFEKLIGQAPRKEERLRTFFQSGWVVQGDGRLLRGEMARIRPAKRVARDEVTGAALAIQPADAEIVIRFTLLYSWEDRPQSLTIQVSQPDNAETANIGFVCYHNGLPINDFRYLPGKVTLDLDWADPWYSRFHNSNLRRQFDSPMSAYLYVEPYEVRKEIIVRPRDLQTWLDLGLQTESVIPVDQQGEMKQRVADFLSKMNPVTIDGRLATGQLDRIHFIHRTLRSTGIIEPAVDLDANSATLGAIYVYPVDGLPEQVSMHWDLFRPGIESIPGVASDEAGGMPAEVTRDHPFLEWTNYLTNPTSPKMTPVPPPPSRRRFEVPLFSVFCGGAITVMLAVLGRQWSKGQDVSRLILAIAITAAGVGALSYPLARVSIANPFEKPPVLSKQATGDVLSSLLRNVYRSVDHHDEDLIYDRLARSISGDLLSDVYLETRKSMEVKTQGGLRISVKEVRVTEIEPLEDAAAEATVRCRWLVSGWVGHWGHVHARANEHEARITIAPRDGMWKITALEMLDEQSLEPSRKPG